MFECLLECLNVCMRGAINFSGMPHDVMKKASHNLCLERLYSQMFAGFILFQCILCLIPIQTHSVSCRCDSGTSPSALLQKSFIKFDRQSSLTLLSDFTAFWLKENVATFWHLPNYTNQHHCIASLGQPLFLEWSFLFYYTEKQQDCGGVAHNLSSYLVVNTNNQGINKSTGESW